MATFQFEGKNFTYTIDESGGENIYLNVTGDDAAAQDLYANTEKRKQIDTAIIQSVQIAE